MGQVTSAKGCPNNVRHWFAPYGYPGVVLPSCVRCGASNPRWTAAVADEMDRMGYGAEWRQCDACRA